MTTSYSRAAGVSERTAEHNQPFFFCSSLPLTPPFKTFVKHTIRDDNKTVWMGSVNTAPFREDLALTATYQRRAFTVNLTAKQLCFRLARIKDCAATSGPPSQPDILDDVLGLRRASENAVLESGAAFGYYVRGMGAHPVRRIPKIPGAHSKNTWIS